MVGFRGNLDWLVPEGEAKGKKGKESRIEVDHKDILENGFEDGNEGFVVRVGEVDRPGLFVLKGDDKAVGESLVQSFGTVVLSPFERAYSGNLSFQCGEFPFDFSDRGRIGIFLELEAHDMTDFPFGRSVRGWFLGFIWLGG